MTNKFRRSVTSVLLAASLLFSSQSVIAFADYGSKSDASDLSPVQESELTVGKSTPMAVPMMMTSMMTPNPSGNHHPTLNLQVKECKWVDSEGNSIDPQFTLSGKINCECEVDHDHSNNCKVSTSLFLQGYVIPDNFTARWDIYDEASGKNWLGGGTFAPGETFTWNKENANSNFLYVTFTQNDDPIGPEDKPTEPIYEELIDVEVKCTTKPGEHKPTPEKVALIGSTYTTIPETWSGEESVTVSLNNPQSDYVNEYLPTGHTLTSTEHQVTLNWDSDKKSWSPDPATITVEATCDDETNPNPPKYDDIQDLIDVKVKCNTQNSGHDEYPSKLIEDMYKPEHLYDNLYTIKIDSTQAESYVANANWDKSHTVDSVEKYAVVKWDGENEKWSIYNEENTIIINTTCTEEDIPPLKPEDLANVWVNFDCLNNNDHDSTHWKSLDQVNQEFYSFTKVTSKNYSVTLNNLSGLIEEYDSTNTHSFVSSEPSYVTMLYKDGKWGVDDDDKNTFTIDILCTPTPKEIEDLLGDMTVNCINPNHPDHPEQTIQKKYPITWDTLGWGNITNNNDGTFSLDVTVSYDPFLKKYNENGVLHKYVPELNDKFSTVHLKYVPNQGWHVEGSFQNGFNVVCDTPDKPTDADLNDVTIYVDCISNLYHDTKDFALIAGTYEFGEVYSIEGQYFCNATVHSNQYVAAYNDKHYPKHNTSEDQYFIFEYKNNKWVRSADSITFKVSCNVPEKPTNPDIENKVDVTVHCLDNTAHHDITSDLKAGTYSVGEVVTSSDGQYICTITVNSNQYVADYNATYAKHSTVPSELVTMKYDGTNWNVVYGQSPAVFKVSCGTKPTDPTDPTDPGTNPGGNGGDNDDDDDRYTGGNTVTRTINDDDVPLNDRPTNTTTIDDEDVPLANLPDDTVTIDDGEVPLKDNPSTGDSLPFAAMAAAALSLGGVIVLNRKKK